MFGARHKLDNLSIYGSNLLKLLQVAIYTRLVRGGGEGGRGSQRPGKEMLYGEKFFCMGPHQVGLSFRQVGLSFSH